MQCHIVQSTSQLLDMLNLSQYCHLPKWLKDFGSKLMVCHLIIPSGHDTLVEKISVQLDIILCSEKQSLLSCRVFASAPRPCGSNFSPLNVPSSGVSAPPIGWSAPYTSRALKSLIRKNDISARLRLSGPYLGPQCVHKLAFAVILDNMRPSWRRRIQYS